MNEERKKTFVDLSQEEWDRIWRRAVERTTKRAALEWRWERRLQTVNRAALIVGVYLIVQFPVLCVGFGMLERVALQLCAAM